MLTIWRRHTARCPHRDQGREYLKCNCPLWADGYVNGKRTLRQSLDTRDMARARKKAVALESADSTVYKPIADAVTAFLDHCNSDGLQFSTIRKYKNSLTQFQEFCTAASLDFIIDVTVDSLDRFRAGRGLNPITSSKELQVLRQFFGFCFDRRWATENLAKRIKPPKNIKPNDVEPYEASEVARIFAACDTFGRGSYERLRARAMLYTFRFTALRVGDVAFLAKDRVNRDDTNDCWRMFLRTEKTGKPVFLRIPDSMKAALDAVPVPRGAEPGCKYYFWNAQVSPRAMKGIVERTVAAVFAKSGVKRAHAHRFRHTLATELLGNGASFEDVADVLGNSPAIVRKHYAKWSPARQARIDALMKAVHAATAVGTIWAQTEEGPVSDCFYKA